jgi:hypothetical protein
LTDGGGHFSDRYESYALLSARLLFHLNEQMSVWAELTGGGPNQPLRVVLYCDIALMNQTTLKLSCASRSRFTYDLGEVDL